MKKSTAVAGGVVTLLCATAILLAIEAIEHHDKTTDAVAVPVQPALNTHDEFRNFQHQGTPQIMEIPQSYSASQGELLIGTDENKLALPLLHTSVYGDIEGFTARVTVHQIYINSLDSTIEALYTFPLPENAAVDSIILEIGDKRIKGVIKERKEARAIYEEARSQGKTTSLLEQQRPNIFTQSVANILPKDTIVITISYLQQLSYKNGKYLYNFPMVVGPRYIPGKMSRNEPVGTENPTDQVPDAHMITPPLLPPDIRSGHDISLQVTIHKCMSFEELTSPSHRISIADKENVKVVSISPNDQIPNKDFILEYSVANDEINTVFLTHKSRGRDGFFQLIMIPKIDINEKEIFPRELVFVVDNSGSMGGYPIEKCKELMKLSLEKMRRDDLFRVIKFSGSTEILSPTPLEATNANVENALDFVDRMGGGGGTEMMSAINAIFDAPVTDGRKRLVLFMTDGYVGNDREIIATIQKRLGNCRVFSLGVGSSVNRYLLEGMAYTGRGNCMIIRQDGDAKKTIDEFYTTIDAPVLTDLTLSWNGIRIIDPQPARLPDLFQNQPLTVTGKYSKYGKGTLTITGRLSGGQNYRKRIDIVFPDIYENNNVLPTLWARKKIEVLELLNSQIFNDNRETSDTVKNTILTLGLEYKIMTQYTSFVAVDDAVRNKSGTWTPVQQPVELPEGVSELSQPGYRYAGSSSLRGSNTCQAIGTNGMRGGGCGGVGRKGVAGIGYGSGYGSGFGGAGNGSVDNLIGGLKAGDGSGGLDLKKRGSIKMSSPEYLKGVALNGGRSKASVMRVVMQNLAALRYSYNKRLRDVPGLRGEMKIKFKIDQNGSVILCEVVSSTLKDTILENTIIAKIKLWKFETIEKKGDITEVVYPFVFSF
jgi:Ca-activated chloride channel family protein